ncbi:hypothetical protein O3Q51_02920 [Cryomorphaceae bacterium 1068]|nr:hypothetical protein [Cryomorphaceae bacterium 1068]
MKTRLTYLFTIVLLGFTAISCNPEEDTIAEIIVVTPEGSRVPGAEVRMFGQGTIDDDQVGDIAIDRTQFTNSNGVAEFDYTDQYEPGQSGFAILDVEITFETPDSTAFVNGIMKVVEEETTTKTFVLGS